MMGDVAVAAQSVNAQARRAPSMDAGAVALPRHHRRTGVGDGFTARRFHGVEVTWWGAQRRRTLVK